MSSHRYTLTRHLGRLDLIDVPLCWVMLNPSTADETVDDPTIRRVKAFTAAARYGKLIVVNLYALRATKPARLLEHPNPVGRENAAVIQQAMSDSARVVFAWGAFASHPQLPAPPDVHDIALGLGHTPLCLGTTNAGHPRHPLYVRADEPLVPWKAPS